MKLHERPIHPMEAHGAEYKRDFLWLCIISTHYERLSNSQALAVADLGGVRGVQLHPPLAGEVHFYAYTT